jgi:AcrR family transcriptional regulator
VIVENGRATALADVRLRIIEGTYACVARQGIAATSIEEAAREAGISRATVYRYFPGGRDELISAVITWETLRFFARLADAVGDARDIETLLVEAVMFAHRAIAGHAVLQKVLDAEPGLLLPKLTVESAHLIELVGLWLAGRLEGHGLPAGLAARDAADFVARMLLSFIGSPGRWDLADREQVATLVRSEMIAGLVLPDDPAAGPAGPEYHVE